MTLKRAIQKATRKNRRIYSASLRMRLQDARSLLYWIVVDPTSNKGRKQALKRLLAATDWELEE